LGIYLAGELIPAASLPDFKATIPGGGSKFNVTVTSRAAFSAAQIRACVLGSTVTISANGINYTGQVTGFGCREGYGLCQIGEATIMGGTGAGLEGHNSRWRKEEGTYVATPASTSTITTLIDRTAAISIGTPVRYEIAGVVYYGMVMNVTTTTITIAGPPLSGDIDDLYFGVSEMVIQLDHDIPGAFAAGAEDELIKTIRKSHSVWRGQPAYLVQIGHIVQALDSGTQPNVTASIGGSAVGTDNTNTGLPVALVLQSTSIGINPSNYRIEYGDAIELATTAGGTGDASDLTVLLTFVSES